MVFHPEGQFRQFPHCKFRENIVRLLYIPSIVDPDQGGSSSTPTHLFLAVNKFGKVGLYHPQKFSLVHTYCLDLSVPVLPSHSRNPPIIPKCQKTHLITDAVFSQDANCVIYSTTKCLLQWYDIGDIQKQDLGLGLFPRREFLTLSEDTFPLSTIPNRGHVECHRLLGLSSIPTCLDYHDRKVIIGDVDGGVTLISIPSPKYPLGRRKIRGKLHKIHVSELPPSIFRQYKGHHHPITDIHWIPERNLILTSSKDKKFSVYVKDTSPNPVESIIVSIPKGVNSIAYSFELKMIATGSDDYVVRLFNQFVMKMPQMEMFGHRSPIITVKFVQLDFFVVGAEQGDNPVLLLSYSADTELRAWDPLTFICLQSLYLSFPVGSTILCKTPEFAKRSLLLLQSRKEPESGGGSNGMIILLYCNSYARIPLEEEGSTRWPGVNYDQFIREFEDLSMEYDKKLKDKLKVTEHKTTLKPLVQAQYHIPPVVIPEEEDEDEEKIEDDSPKKSGEEEDKVCIRLTKTEKSQMAKKVDDYLQEILELRRTIQQESGGEASTSIPDFLPNTGRHSESTGTGGDEDERGEFPSPTHDPLTISIQATNRFFQFRRSKQSNFQGLPKPLQRMISYGHAFNQYPLLELEPLQFSRENLPLPEHMKKTLGITTLNHVEDLMTPEAQRYFGLETNRTKTRGQSSTYNFNNSPQKQKQPSDDDLQRNSNPAASRFTVVGQRIRNVYEEDETFMQSVSSQEDESEDRQNLTDFH